jgi:hypothetical protein
MGTFKRHRTGKDGKNSVQYVTEGVSRCKAVNYVSQSIQIGFKLEQLSGVFAL